MSAARDTRDIPSAEQPLRRGALQAQAALRGRNSGSRNSAGGGVGGASHALTERARHSQRYKATSMRETAVKWKMATGRRQVMKPRRQNCQLYPRRWSRLRDNATATYPEGLHGQIGSRRRSSLVRTPLRATCIHVPRGPSECRRGRYWRRGGHMHDMQRCSPLMRTNSGRMVLCSPPPGRSHNQRAGSGMRRPEHTRARGRVGQGDRGGGRITPHAPWAASGGGVSWRGRRRSLEASFAPAGQGW